MCSKYGAISSTEQPLTPMCSAQNFSVSGGVRKLVVQLTVVEPPTERPCRDHHAAVFGAAPGAFLIEVAIGGALLHVELARGLERPCFEQHDAQASLAECLGSGASAGTRPYDDDIGLELERRRQLAGIGDVPAALGGLVVGIGVGAEGDRRQVRHGVTSSTGAAAGTTPATFLGGPGYPVVAAFSGMRYQALMMSRITAA